MDEDGADDGDEDETMGGADLTSDQLSSLMAERMTEEQTADLMQKFQDVMKRCEEQGTDPDEELKKRERLVRPLFLAQHVLMTCLFAVVEETIFNTMDAGKRIGEEQAEMEEDSSTQDEPSASKRSRPSPNR